MSNWKELAPDIFRQRLIIEATTIDHVDAVVMYDYLTGLTEALQMARHSGPNLSHHASYGWCGHMHWVTSGAHMYTWDNKEVPFFTVDIYTCKLFKVEDAVNYTRKFFKSVYNEIDELVWKEI